MEIKEKESHLIALQKEYFFNEDILKFYREIMKLYHEILHVEKLVAAKDFLGGLVKLEGMDTQFLKILNRLLIKQISTIQINIFLTIVLFKLCGNLSTSLLTFVK